MTTPVKYYGRNDVARGVQDYYDKLPGRNQQRAATESLKQSDALKRQQEADAKAFDEALFRDAQMQGGGAIRDITAAPAQQPPAAPGAAPAPQPSMTDRRIEAFRGVRGGGAQAQKIRSTRIAGVKKHEQQIYELLKVGDPGSIQRAKYISKQNNIGIPDAFFDDPYIRATLVEAITEGQKVTDNPRTLDRFIQSFFSKNPELLERVARSQEAGRGLPGAYTAAAESRKQIDTEKVTQKTALSKQKQRNAQAVNRYPEERMRLELTKMYSGQKNRYGEPMYTPEQVRVMVDQEIMRKTGDAPAQTTTPMSVRDWAEKETGRK